MNRIDGGVVVSMERSPDSPFEGSRIRSMCLSCCHLFFLDVAVPVVRAGGEILGRICPACLEPDGRLEYQAACRRFHKDCN
jgi:hypothetical protein